jgi:aspartyl-tRNA synthetase
MCGYAGLMGLRVYGFTDGCRPTAGSGIDRLCMMLLGQERICGVIFSPAVEVEINCNLIRRAVFE